MPYHYGSRMTSKPMKKKKKKKKKQNEKEKINGFSQIY